MSRASLRSNPRLRGRGRHRSPWTPRRLAPRAWYDAELGQPKYVGYVQLNGGSTDNISVPDTAFNSFSNDIEVIMRVRPDDWTTGAIQTLCGKYLTTGNQRSWRFYISATGTIGLTASVDGTAVTTVIVTPTTPFVDATWIWLRLRLDLTNGANSVGTVDTAADTDNNYTVPTSWTANGSNTGTTISGIFNGTGLVEIGAFSSGTSERLAGRVGRCIVKAGFDGVVTSDFNADDCYGPGYSSVTTLPVDINGYNHVPLSGVSGDYIYTADKASLDITGDIEIVTRIALDDWTPSATQVIASKWHTTGNQRSFHVSINTNGTLALVTTADGSTQLAHTSTTAVPFADGAAGWIKITFDVDDGVGNRVARFYTATDQLAEPSEWTQLGTTVTTAGVTSIFSGSAVLMFGSFITGTSFLFTGELYRVIVRNGIDGTTVADYDASLSTVDGQVDAYNNQWIINQSKYLGTWTLGIPKIYDRSGNNVAPAVFGSGTNQPRWLSWTGVHCVHLETAGAGTNSISCTAPSGAASYVARSRDYPTVADATGVASAGAFSFATAGQWQYVSILNGSATEIARFDAALCSQSGMIDSYSVTWTVNRGTSGRKTVVQSSAAKSARSVILLGTDDWIDVPAAAIPALDTFAAASSIIAAFRRWHNPGASGHAIFATKANAAGATLGTSLRLSPTAVSPIISQVTSDGTVGDQADSTVALGTRGVTSLQTQSSSPFLTLRTNAETVGVDTSLAATVSTTTGAAGRIGAYTGGTAPIDMEFDGIVFRDDAVSAIEHSRAVEYYNGGL